MAFDYNSNLQFLENSLRSKSEWADLLFFGTNQRLLQIVAEITDRIAQYDEYLTRETRWSLARNISSLLNQAQFLQYNAARKTGATGSIRVSASETFDSPPPATISIPKNTVFATASGVFFSSVTNNNLVANVDDFIDVDVIQGEPVSFTTTALGSINEIIDIENPNIANSNFSLTVDGEAWVRVRDLREYNGTEKVYELDNLPNYEGVRLLFGDDLNGKKLSTGQTIVFSYIETLGINGNITQSGIVNTVISSITDANNDVVELFVTNPEQIVGGNREEDIEDIRANAPSAFFAGQRAVSREDYRALLSQNNNVLKSTVWGAYEINQDNGTPGAYLPDIENFVYIAIVSTALGNISTATQDEIRDFLNELKSPTDVISFVPVQFVKIIFKTNVFITDRSQVLSEVKASVQTALAERYSVETMEFNENIYESDYQTFIDQIDGVGYHNTSIQLLTSWNFSTAQYESGTTLLLPPIAPNSVSIFVKHTTESDNLWRLVAVDNGINGFDDSVSSFTLNTTISSINYTTGDISIAILSGLPLADFPLSTFDEYEIKAEYSITTSNGVSNFILDSREQIFDISRAEVNVQYA